MNLYKKEFKVDMSLKIRKMTYEKAKITVILKYFFRCIKNDE